MDPKQKETEHNPHFHNAVTDQVHVTSEGEAEMSLYLPPSTEEHFMDYVSQTAREKFFDVTEFREEHAADRLRIQEEYKEKIITESEDGLHVEIRIVNKQASEGTIGYMTPWSVDPEWDETKNITEALALTNPTMRIIYICTPGMGDSSAVTSERRREMVKTGSYGPMAEQISAALKAAGYGSFDVILGQSEGGRIAVSLADKLDVPLIVTLDPPGNTEQPFISFAKKFAVDEAKGQEGIVAFSPDAPINRDEDGKRLMRDKKVLGRNLIARAMTMAKGGYADDIRQAVSGGKRKIIDFRAQLSKIGNSDTAEELARTIPGYETITLKNIGHSVVDGNPYASASLLQQALELDRAER